MKVNEKVNVFLEVTGLNKNPKAVNNQLKALDEEINELSNALEMKDKIQILDGLGDVCFIIQTLMVLDPKGDYHKLLNDIVYVNTHSKLVDELVDRVCDSNLSKFDLDENEAVNTQLWYGKIKDIETYIDKVGDYYINKSAKTQTDNTGKEIFHDKILKSASNFKDIKVKDLVDSL